MNKPFLKWLGGKTRLINDIKEVLPRGKRLVEPFTGSGAVFLNTSYEEYLLADSNRDLINLYAILKSKGRSFLKICNALFIPEYNTEKKYLELRAEFNKTSDEIRKASVFIYLNRHCFNGLCRYNSSGEFNTPFGLYGNPVHFPSKEMLYFIEKCRSKKVDFVHADFRKTFKMIKDGDILYCDPPYLPLSETSNFTSYGADGFNDNDQEELARLSSKALVPVLISNHDTEGARKMYNKASYIQKINVGRFVGGDRKMVPELLALFNANYEKKTLWN